MHSIHEDVFYLKNTAQTFKRLVNEMILSLNGIFVYNDDVLITNNDIVKHKQTLATLFVGLTNRHVKCSQAMKNLKTKNISFLRVVKSSSSVLNMVNFYRRLVANCTDIPSQIEE
ncbi:unnamed protein product [Protopolystoma xenopodis]|uniref:Reverse transcriptase domain-containing protein n=1 Tax=Protopolystoma xenopodis TaxID=117903 RepID=A0A448WFJ3_9PLAT|nr:unnamed protein product [Protopolystoma xenopodis]